MTEVTPDGSPVAFYRRLPAAGEPELIHRVIPAGATVPDLGCGPGRIAGPLAALGHRVTGVDDGPAMIAALPSAVEGVVGDTRGRSGWAAVSEPSCWPATWSTTRGAVWHSWRRQPTSRARRRRRR